MENQVIQNWTDSQVLMKHGITRDVRYKIFKSGPRLFQEVRDIETNLVHRLELPQGVPLEKNSYEVLLRYVLANVVEA